MVDSRSKARNNTGRAWNILTYRIEKKLLKTMRTVSEGVQPEESSTGQR